MKSRRIVIIALALVAALTLGVGYAALNDALTVGGTGTLTKTNADDLFDGLVYFEGDPVTTNCDAELASGDKPDSATITIDDTNPNHNIAIMGDVATATFTVKNDSTVPVTIVTNTSTDSEHFRVTAVYPEGQNVYQVEAGKTTTITVKVSLKNTVAADVTGETFNISFNVASAG